MIKIKREFLANAAFRKELLELVEQHTAEVGLYDSKLDLQLLQEIENRNSLFIFTVRAYGQLVGYTGVTLNADPFYKGEFTVSINAFFIKRFYRFGWLVKKLLTHLNQFCDHYKIKKISMEVPLSNQNLWYFLQNAGFFQVSTTYVRYPDG